MDKSINDSQDYKIKLESKPKYYKERLMHVQKNINELDKNIEVTKATKIKVCIWF